MGTEQDVFKASELSCGTLTLRIYPHENGNDARVFLPDGHEDSDAVYALLTPPRPTLVVVSGISWNRDLSPWTHPPVFGDEPFEGGADAFLRQLEEEVLSMTDRTVGAGENLIAGYSLAGLFAVYAVTKSDRFRAAASMSGSLWYSGFLSYLKEHPVSPFTKAAAFSVGGKEKNTKNQLMATVEDATRETESLLRAHGVKTDFRIWPGGHFADVPRRIAGGIDAALRLLSDADTKEKG